MSRQLIWSVLLLLGAGAVVTAMIMLRSEPEEKEQVVTAPLVQTTGYLVDSGPLEIEASGTVQAREEVSLGAEVSGKLTYVNPNFREGSMVARGTLLFRIDGADYRNMVRVAQADVAAQDVAVLQAREEMAIAEAELARFNARQASRNANGSDTRILAPTGLQSGPGQTTGAGSTSASITPNILATREPQLRVAKAARERAAAQLADARLALSRTEVRTPFSGVVRSESAAVGSLVQPGSVLGSIVATGAYELRVSLTETEAALIPGLFSANRGRIPAKVRMEYGGQTYQWNAFVDRADAILDPETRTIDIFLKVSNPLSSGSLVSENDGEETASQSGVPPLLLGSFARASILGASPQAYAAIPIDALRADNKVWIVRDGKLRIIDVKVIQRGDNTAHVASSSFGGGSAGGLGEGGQIVISKIRAPVEGMAVRSNSDQASPAPVQADQETVPEAAE